MEKPIIIKEVQVPISIGELIDKITILRIKSTRLLSPDALTNVETELNALTRVLIDAGPALRSEVVLKLTSSLEAINRQLWDVEDHLRLLEAEQRFDGEFVSSARSVYQLNDQRAALKRKINEICGSSLIEEKSYGKHKPLPTTKNPK